MNKLKINIKKDKKHQKITDCERVQTVFVQCLFFQQTTWTQEIVTTPHDPDG